MRDILFRGKKLIDGSWVQGYLFQVWEKVYILWGTTNDHPNMTQVIPETVGQYTGMKDKNGKRVFEGDIIQIGKKCENKKGVVNFHDHCFCVSYNKLDEFNRNNPALDIIENEYPNDVEVIGDIHSNEKTGD